MPNAGDVVDGKYEILGVLGIGGMATVYEASHLETELHVAIKFLHPQFAEDTDVQERFKLEAEAASAAGHESVISIYETGVTDGGCHYIVMDFLKGRSLGQLLRLDGRLDIDLCVYIGCQILSALSAVHQTGIVHRDLKLDNVFLVESPSRLPAVKLLDFGLSRIAEASSFGQEHAGLTRKGMSVGTPAYMSPEQARGEQDLDHRADLYSVGMILYQCLTGVSPFHTDNPQETMYKIVTELAPPVRDHRPEVPEGLAGAVELSLAKSRGVRFQTAEEMFAEIVRYASKEAVEQITPLQERYARTAHIDAMSSEDFEKLRTRAVNAAPVAEASAPDQQTREEVEPSADGPEPGSAQRVLRRKFWMIAALVALVLGVVGSVMAMVLLSD